MLFKRGHDSVPVHLTAQCAFFQNTDSRQSEDQMKIRRKPRSNDFKGFLDHGTALTGELSFSGTLRIDGTVHGSISTNDLLIVGNKASINADIRAGEVQIYGAVYGNVESNRRVEIYSSGSLKGDVRTPQLVIEEGGRFEGRSRGPTDSDSDMVSDYGENTASPADHG
jgi:cytoskeletal protein CcmA (bactofilin family)